MAALVFLASPAAADSEDPLCIVTLEAVGKAASEFNSFPAPVENIKRPAPLDLASDPIARQFRTAIRNALRNGANFAGHYAIATWGCGTACQDWAIVDVKTGRVHSEPTLRPIDVIHGVGLVFQRDSNLLAILGAPHEDPSREGASFYVWQHATLKLKSFVPKRNSCRSE
jgi:hypothetical protein